MIRLILQLLGLICALGALLFTYRLGGGSALIILALAAIAGALLAGTVASRGPATSSTDARESSNQTIHISQELQVVSTRELLEATLNSMREGVLVVAPEGRIVASNAAAQVLFSAGSDRLESRRLIDVTRQPAIHEAFRAAMENGERAEVKVETQAPDRRIFELRVAPLRLARVDQGRGAIGVFFDITRLEALERTRQEFLSNVSHELRTPLTSIIAFVETLEDGAIDDPENNWRFLDIIRKNSERMHNLIDDILELSSIEAGNVSLEPRPVRLSALVEDISVSLASRAAAREVAIRNQVDTNITVVADRRRLEQMLTNLIDNAIKFNRVGGEIKVGYLLNGRHRITVADEGEGISAEHIDRIFERFYRVDRARSRELGGTGLGLAIVKHLARAHGGEATVSSAPSAGSTFTIELPNEP